MTLDGILSTEINDWTSDSVEQDQIAHYVQADLDLHSP